MTELPSTALGVAKYAPGSGFAWDRLEGLYGGVSRHLQEHGIRFHVAYPLLHREPDTLADSPARAVELDARLYDWRSVVQTVRYVRREGVRLFYTQSSPVWRLAFPILRAAGVRHIIVHDHSSGVRTVPGSVKGAVKRLVTRMPGLLADRVIAGSEFVVRRHLEVGKLPPDRVVRIYNGVEVPRAEDRGEDDVLRQLGVGPDRPVVACVARAVPEKGVDWLLEAFSRVSRAWPDSRREPVLVYVGEGPNLAELQTQAESLADTADVVFAGYVPGAIDKLANADVFVVPSRWQDAFPYSVLEPMSRGHAVIGSEVGGIPEQIVHGETGRLVPADDVEALAREIRDLLLDPGEAERLGRNARRWIAEHLDFEQQIQKLTAMMEEGFGLDCFPRPPSVEERRSSDPAGGSTGGGASPGDGESPLVPGATPGDAGTAGSELIRSAARRRAADG